MFGEDFVWPLWSAGVAVDFVDEPDRSIEDAVLARVSSPGVFGFVPRQANGAAVLICAGGGYTKLVIGKEGVEIARWLAGAGFHAFVLAHRFPDAANGAQAPLDDAIEAMRLIRARGAAMGIQRVGALGLSSGGHLAAALACDYPALWHAPSSAYPGVGSRSDFLIVGYAPISTNAVGRTVVDGKVPLAPPEKQALYDIVQPDAQLTPDPPPAFLFYSASDAVVPLENGRRLQAAFGARAELHIFNDAPHGFALRTPDSSAGQWPKLCVGWLTQNGILR